KPLPLDFRTGIGYDRHLLKPGTGLILGGVTVAFEKSLVGHSDGDVLLHALVDALLGGAALGDIGTHFPDTDARWKGVDSARFVEHACSLLAAQQFEISFVDAIILAEKPKLAPYFTPIRENLARLLTLPLDRLSVKAKTEEGTDAIGEGKAIAAFVAATLRRE